MVKVQMFTSGLSSALKNLLRGSEKKSVFFSFFVFPVSEEVCFARRFVLIIFPDKPVTENPVSKYDRKTLQADLYKNCLDKTIQASETSHTKTKLR